jgi:hypothetical protein
MSIVAEKRVNSIYQAFTSGDYYVEFMLEFGKGTDSSINPDDSRMSYSDKDKFIMEEVVFDDGAKNYRIIGTEAPIVAKISNIRITNNDEIPNYKYKYGIGFAMDKEQPTYRSNLSSEPNNIERDGKMWHIDANNNGVYRLDQNAGARYQMYLKKAKKIGEELTEQEKLIGVEETSDKTGEFYITIMVCESKTYVEPTNTTRGFAVTKGMGATRGSRTRGGGCDYETGSIGYGSVANTSSTESELKYVDSPKIIIPMRFKVLSDSEVTEMLTSKDLSSAKSAEELQKMYKPKVF